MNKRSIIITILKKIISIQRRIGKILRFKRLLIIKSIWEIMNNINELVNKKI